MYASEPTGETKKRTLEAGDIEGILALYPDVDEVDMNDDFNDNRLETRRWVIEGSPPVGLPGTLAEVNQQLEITSAGFGGAGIFSQCTISGDFDVEVTYRLLNWPANNFHSVQLRLLNFGSGPFGSPGPFRFSGVVEMYGMVFSDRFQLVGTTHSAGRLRVTRVGSLLSGYFHDGASWVLISSDHESTAPTRVALEVGTSDPDAPSGIRGAFDNFKVNAGTISCPSVEPVVVFSNLSASDSFYWVGRIICADARTPCSPDALAQSFSPEVDGKLDRIELPIGFLNSFVPWYPNAPNSLTVALMTDVAGKPGTVIEEFRLTDLPTFSFSPPLFTPLSSMASSERPILRAGVRYWVSASVPSESASVFDWHFCGDGVNVSGCPNPMVGSQGPGAIRFAGTSWSHDAVLALRVVATPLP